MKTRIFIVDDHALLRRGLAALISEEPDMEVCGEADGQAGALEAIGRCRPSVVIVDLSLRGKSGLDLIIGIKALDPRIGVLVFSIHDEALYGIRALSAGALGYVMKREHGSRVIEGIRRIREGQLYCSAALVDRMLTQLNRGDTGETGGPKNLLSPREIEIVELIGQGLQTREIAVRLHLSVKTIETHRAHIKSKLGLADATRLVQFCVQWVTQRERPRETPAANGSPPPQPSRQSLLSFG